MHSPGGSPASKLAPHRPLSLTQGRKGAPGSPAAGSLQRPKRARRHWSSNTGDLVERLDYARRPE